MNTSRRLTVGIVALIVAGVASSSWAWRGGGGWRGGYGGWHGGGGWYGGPRVGLYVGAPYAYGYPYYGGYPYPYQAPYVYPYDGDGYYAYGSDMPEYEGTGGGTTSTSYGTRDLKGVERTYSDLQAQTDHDYDDGDISRDQRNARLKTLKDIREEARKEASLNGGSLTPEQADTYVNRMLGRNPAASSNTPQMNTPSSSQPPQHSSALSVKPLNSVSDLLLELRTLLDQKVKDGDVTAAQARAERSRLDQLEQESKQGGDPNDLTNRLHREYYQINHNFVGG